MCCAKGLSNRRYEDVLVRWKLPGIEYMYRRRGVILEARVGGLRRQVSAALKSDQRRGENTEIY